MKYNKVFTRIFKYTELNSSMGDVKEVHEIIEEVIPAYKKNLKKGKKGGPDARSEEHTSELQSH